VGESKRKAIRFPPDKTPLWWGLIFALEFLLIVLNPAKFDQLFFLPLAEISKSYYQAAGRRRRRARCQHTAKAAFEAGPIQRYRQNGHKRRCTKHKTTIYCGLWQDERWILCFFAFAKNRCFAFGIVSAAGE
jgi:hypothetical protein